MAHAELPEEVSFSGDLAWIYASPVVSTRVQAVDGQGFRIQPALEVRLSDHLSLRTHAGYQWVSWGASRTSGGYSFFGITMPTVQIDSSYRLQLLSLGSALQLEFFSAHRSFVSLGASLETPFQAHYEVESWTTSSSGARTKQLPLEGSFGDDLMLGYCDIGAGVQVWRSLGLVLGYRVPIRCFEGPLLHQFVAGVRWHP